MKKFLAILCLLLALCMIYSVALATDDDEGHGDSDFEGISYEEAMRVHEVGGHPVSNPRLMRASTCTERGIVRYDCGLQPNHFHELYLKLAPHDWVYTCLDRTCKVCGKNEKLKAPYNHIWASQYNDPNGNWTAADKAKYSPIDLNLSSSVPNDISWGRVIKEPTCTEKGEAIDFCPRCGAERRDDPDSIRYIQPLGHNFKRVVIKEPNCKEEGISAEVCTRCGYEKPLSRLPIPIRVPALDTDHDWDKPVVGEAPTCYKTGELIQWCKRCGDKKVAKILPKLDPVWVPRDARLINCYEKEITYYCALCNSKADASGYVPHPEFTTKQDVIAHTFIHEKQYEVGYKAPTCTEPGYRLYKCIYDGVAHFNCPHVVGDKYEYEKVVIPALGHDWNKWEKRYDIEHEGAHNDYGYWLRDCKRCGLTEERISNFAPEDACPKHEYGAAPIESKAPTCTAGGFNKYQCTICGHINTVEVPATGHDFAEFVSEATCTDEGTLVKVCKVCNYAVTEPIPAKGHTPKVVEGKPATCLEDGLTDGEVCAVCGVELKAQAPIPAVGHHDYQKLEAVAATCTTAGKTEGVACSVCGDALIPQEEVPALGHNWVEEESVAATCTTAGKKGGVVCSVCGEVKSEAEEIPALGHTWNDGEITKEATYAEDGEITYTCTACGEKKVEAVEFVPTADPVYTITASYDGTYVTGSVEHDPSTKKAAALYVRVSVFFNNGTSVIGSGIVDADGKFSVGAAGDSGVLRVVVNLTETPYNMAPGFEAISTYAF